MDIAKYAGLFFLRSEYIYLPGIGNLEIKKGASHYDSESKQIVAGPVAIDFKPSVGVIDDAFANFVANNERISIASAANAIKEFGFHVKQAIKDNREVEVPSIGTFYNNNGTIGFRVSEQYTYVPKSIPIFKNVSRTEEYSKEKDIKTIIQTTEFKVPNAHEEIELEKPKVNYGKLAILILVAAAVLGVIGYIIYKVINENSAETTKVEKVVNKDIDPTVISKAQDSAALSVAQNDTNAQNLAANSGDDYKIIVNEYINLSTAEKRKAKLESYSYKAELVSKDSLHYVVVNIPKTNGEAQQMIDSVKRMLSPKYDVRLLN